ncbi:MAG: hypothetical protein AVDCRST_MAG72-896, partial [uncultured Nocardioidaceae bacterium]
VQPCTGLDGRFCRGGLQQLDSAHQHRDQVGLQDHRAHRVRFGGARSPDRF